MKLITCEFNMDSGCVEMRFDEGTALILMDVGTQQQCSLTIDAKVSLRIHLHSADTVAMRHLTNL